MIKNYKKRLKIKIKNFNSKIKFIKFLGKFYKLIYNI